MSSDSTTIIRRLLVANRGEIARRIFRTAHDMGIETVAVFADADAAAPFVAEAHQAIALRGRTPADTYLNVAKLLDAARLTGAEAVHPGYGFLAENAGFARAVIEAGLIWVGPSPDAIAAMGDKLAAKAMMAEAGVPTLPSIEVTDDLDLADAAEDIGYPILVKATAGGGGKGMRVVESADLLAEAVAGAQREAASAFGNGVVFLEKYLPAPRHIEIQVLGDQHGSLVHLFERECSIQRRHQKIIEEAPSPALATEVRAAMGEAALAAARAIGYHSAGTVEFLLDGQGADADFWFLEVNTRIQVEHPVTEQITGVDLVREQLRVACGHGLGFTQSDLTIDGHSIEARLYAEDPAQGFLPATGTLHAFEVPAGAGVRIDSGVERGSVVGVDFDPMLAKIIVHAPTRTEAATRLALVLDRMTLAGVTTNRDFLVATLRHQAFLDGDTTTDFITRVAPSAAFEPDQAAVDEAARAVTLYHQALNRTRATPLAFMPGGYRNSSMPPERAGFRFGEDDLEVHYSPRRHGGFDLAVKRGDDTDGPGAAVQARVVAVDFGPVGSIVVETDGVRGEYRIVEAGDVFTVHGRVGTITLQQTARFPDHGAVEVAGGQTAPMPGRILSVRVAVDDVVAGGQTLIVMEAMKMEHTISARGDAVVRALHCAVGDQVDNGQLLIVLEELEGD